MKKFFTSSGILWSCFVALAMMMTSQSARAEYVKLTAIDGMLSYYQFDTSHKEAYPKLVDANIDTKWGGWFNIYLSDEAAWPKAEDSANKMYIIVKAEKPVVPTYYFLVTGNDTGSNPGRNWATWKIYGGNFADDADAVREGEGWTLIDNREDEPLPAQDFGVANLDFSESPKVAYQYYWIEILKAVTDGEVYLQMSEWGLGPYAQFEQYLEELDAAGTPTDEPVKFSFLDASAGNSGEQAKNLFDGSTSTKWCSGFTNRNEGDRTNGAYVVFKASRSMVPTYYTLFTANDTDPWSGRNWKQWQIYGMNADNDEDVTRNSDGWELIDAKYDVPAGTDLNQLPAANYARALFTVSGQNTTAYRYFKVEIDKCISSGIHQMSELAIGDDYTVLLDRNAIADDIAFDPDAFAEKTLLDQMGGLIDQIRQVTEFAQLAQLKNEIGDLAAVLATSAYNYAQLATIRNQALLAIDGGNLKEEGIEYLTAWASETDVIAPCEDYPVGNYAYIKANRQLTGEQALAESKRVDAIIFNQTANQPAPITATYQFLRGTTDNWQTSEGPEYLIDGQSGLNGTNSTKWGTGTSGDRFVIFKSVNVTKDENGIVIESVDQPIQPTYYGLVTGGDTSDYPDRNWKNWKIWGANFDSDDAATKNASGWVLIDNKQNVGTDVLKTTSMFESYIYLSEGCAVPYTYFKIEVYHEGGMQMNEFTFYNSGNLLEYRKSFIDEFKDYNPTDRPAYPGYVDAYYEKHEQLENTVSAPDLMKVRNELKDIQNQIEKSADLYEDYDLLCTTEVAYADLISESLTAWQQGYMGENVAPNSLYIRGTYQYIMENHPLDNEALTAEIDYLHWILNATDPGNDIQYILLGGHTVGEWGDGFYGNLIDGIDKDIYDETSPIDQATGKPSKKLVNGTKWGGSADENGDTYIIFRTIDKTNPFFYTLTTGNDTQRFPGRNWGTWYIYGANFDGDAAATKDAEGWVLIDNKENTGQDRLHPENETPSYFGFSTETTDPYTYYKIVVTKAYDGSAIQMNEFHFGTEEEFNDIKEEYTTNANNFVTNIIADQALIDEYEAKINEIDECGNMEALFRVNYDLEKLRDAITASAALYERYATKAEENRTYLNENALTSSEALTTFVNYLNNDIILGVPSETYPNGVVAYVLAEHVLNDSLLLAEIDFMESLKVAAVSVGYGKGTDISCMIVNRTFKKAGDMLKQGNDNIGREAEGWNGYIYRTAKADNEDIYAAEFVNVNQTFDINQTLSNLQNGFYKVTLNAAYRANGDEKMLSYNYAAMAYANETYTYVPVIREDAAPDPASSWQGYVKDLMIYSADSTEEFGLGIWGCEGAANAFGQGRYAITLVAQVTDGKLTIGVKNDGTTLANEWTAAGNFGLWYLGENESDATDALREAAAYNTARATTMTVDYEPYPCDDKDFALAPNFGDAQRTALLENSQQATYEAQKLVGEIMQSVYDTKKAYVVLVEAAVKVSDKWINYLIDSPMENDVATIQQNLDSGVYDDAEAALNAKAELFAKYPDYLEPTGSAKLDYAQGQEEFLFDVATSTDGTNAYRPYIDMTKIYEPLEKDEVILAFEYTAEQPLENGRILYLTPNLQIDPMLQLPTLPATEAKSTVYLNVTAGINAFKLGSAVSHGIRWYINYSTPAETELALTAGRFRFITKAQMVAEGGKALNGGDVNNDGITDIADAVTVLNAMAGQSVTGDADVNGDGVVDIADFVTVLNFMAGVQ